MNARMKFPRTPHLPYSPGGTNDDRRLQNDNIFAGKRVIVSEKMDGENTTMYCDHIHARSIDSAGHPSRNWIRKFHASIMYNIPFGWRVCVENVFAQHSVAYSNLESYAYGICVWDEVNQCLPWEITLEWFELLGIEPVRVIYVGEYNQRAIMDAFDNHQKTMSDGVEGFVVRADKYFPQSEYAQNVAKYVRENHVQTDTHWMHQAVVPNRLK